MVALIQAPDRAQVDDSMDATVSRLHVALAKKSAEVEKLRSSLSIMQASAQNPPSQVTAPFRDADIVNKAQQCVPATDAEVAWCEMHSTAALLVLTWTAQSPSMSRAFSVLRCTP